MYEDNPIITGMRRAIKAGSTVDQIKRDSVGEAVAHPGGDEFDKGWNGASLLPEFDAYREEFNELMDLLVECGGPWEYAVRDASGRVWFRATAGARPGDVAIRRRKAGEWEEVPA